MTNDMEAIAAKAGRPGAHPDDLVLARAPLRDYLRLWDHGERVLAAYDKIERSSA